MGEKPANFDNDGNRPKHANPNFAVPQGIEVQREKYIDTDVREHVKKCGDEKPFHRFLDKHWPNGHLLILNRHSLLQVWQKPHTDRDSSQTQHGPSWKIFHAEMLKPSACHEHRDQEADGAKQTHAAIALGIKGPALTHQMRHRCFAHGHHRAGVRKHHQKHKPKTNGAKLHEQQTSTDQRHASAITKQLHTLASMVTEPAPPIRCKQASRSLNGSEDADGHQAKAKLFQPQRQIRVEETDVGKVAGRYSRKGNQLTAIGRCCVGHQRPLGCGRTNNVAALGSVLQHMVDHHQCQHGLGNGCCTNTHAWVVTALGEHLNSIALRVNGGTWNEN